ncbi:MAG: hypothetical protein AABZ47_13095 [Planctomycetota bacterium]
MALTANREVPHLPDKELREFPVATAVKIYKGALLTTRSTGFVGPFADEGTEQFAGIAYEEADNTGGANGAKKVRAYTEGDFELPLSGAAQTDLHDLVYGSADDTLTKTATAHTRVGRIMGFPSAGKVLVRIDEALGATTP